MSLPQNPDQVVSPPDGKGFFNIGSHPDNDVVLKGENVLPFHMMLDYRQAPYRVVPLSSDSGILLNNRPLSAYDSYNLQESDTLDVGGYRLRVRPGPEGAPPKLAISSPAANTGFVEAGYRPPLAPLEKERAALVDSDEKLILASLEQPSVTVDVEQTACYILTVINGSPLVSTFNVRVEGVPEEWVFISPQNVNLYEGARAAVQIEITPPRKPSSKAGIHPLRLVVTSLNHPGIQTVVEASLEIKPFYDFLLGDLSPRKKTIAYRNLHGEVKSEITNRGNSTSAFTVTAQDDEAGCRFHFLSANGLKQTGIVEYQVQAGESQPLPILISPVKKRLISLRIQSFPFRVVVTQPENNGLSMFTMGTAVARPLIGPIGIILCLLLLAAAVAYLFTPRVQYFYAKKNIVSVGESTTLEWSTSFFTRKLSIVGINEPVTDVRGRREVFPPNTVNTYTLQASSWLWNLLGLEKVTRSISILSIPGEPAIRTFTVSSNEALQGDSVSLRWSVSNADKVLLTINGVTEIFEDPKDFNGVRPLLLEKNTLIYLEAVNTLGSVTQSQYVFANPPSIVIEEFTLDQTTIYKGDQVTIRWKVSGTGMENGGTVTIAPFESILPLEGELTFFPSESMEFVLTATNRQAQEVRILPVGVLDPEAPPVPPVIDFFTAAPDTITGPGKVELAWSVSGMVTNIKITNADNVIFDSLPAQGFKRIDVTESGTYVLNATYGDQAAGSNLKITVNPALISLKLTINNVYPTELLEVGETISVSASLEEQPQGSPPPTGKIIVSDGNSSCVIELPETSCQLELETPGEKTIRATYQGDTHYVGSRADDYPTKINVMGFDLEMRYAFNPDKLSSSYNYGEPVQILVSFQDINQSHIPDGEVRIYKTVCSGDPPVCWKKAIAYHKFTSADSGVYTFTIAHLDEMGELPLTLSFTGDSYYDPIVKETSITVNPATKSPVSILATASLNPTPSAGNATQFTIKVQDNNIYGLYSYPTGTVSLTATHSDGTTQVSCNNLTLTEDTTDTTQRTSTVICDLIPTKAGAWTLSAQYTPASADIVHETSTTLNSGSTSPFDVNDSVTITFNPSPPSSLTYGVTTPIGLDISSGASTLTTGTLTYRYSVSANTKEEDCAYSSVDSKWICNVKATVIATSLPIRFRYTPPPGLYLNVTDKNQNFQVVRADTTISLLQPDLSNGYLLFNQDQTIQVNVTSSLVGDPPADGTVRIQAGTGTCNASTGMPSNTVKKDCTFNLTSGNTCTINFDNSNYIGTQFTFCYRYDGNSTTGGYNPSSWVQSELFYVKSNAISFNTANFEFSASNNSSVTSDFTVTVTGRSGTNINPANVQIVDAANPGTVICPSTTGADFTCTRVTTTPASPLTVTFRISAAAYKSLAVIPVYTGDNSYLAATGTGAQFTLTSIYKMALPSAPAASYANMLTYASVELEGLTTQDGDIQQNSFTGSFSMVNFPDVSRYNGVVQLIPVTPGGDLAAVGSCTFTNVGAVTCSNVTVTDSAITGFYLKLIPTIPAQYDATSLSSPIINVAVRENIIEGNGDNDITGYDINPNYSCDAHNKLVINITGYSPYRLEGAQALNPNDFAVYMACKFNAPNDDGDNEDLYSNFSTDPDATKFTYSSVTWTQEGDLWKFYFEMYTNDEGCGKYMLYAINNVQFYLFHRAKPSYVPVAFNSTVPGILWPGVIPNNSSLSNSDYEPFVEVFFFDENSAQKGRDFTCE